MKYILVDDLPEEITFKNPIEKIALKTAFDGGYNTYRTEAIGKAREITEEDITDVIRSKYYKGVGNETIEEYEERLSKSILQALKGKGF